MEYNAGKHLAFSKHVLVFSSGEYWDTQDLGEINKQIRENGITVDVFLSLSKGLEPEIVAMVEGSGGSVFTEGQGRDAIEQLRVKSVTSVPTKLDIVLGDSESEQSLRISVAVPLKTARCGLPLGKKAS